MAPKVLLKGFNLGATELVVIKVGTLGFAAELTTSSSSMLPIIDYSWAETEAALIENFSEAAFVDANDDLTGQAVNAFVASNNGNEENDQIHKDLSCRSENQSGLLWRPKTVSVVDGLPRTGSGKIVRHVPRKILSGERNSLEDIL
ncbi:acetyl-CoA synthetase [Sticta canariensis]|nr:acetyl-CoA synthetase [Sticta canariensis]